MWLVPSCTVFHRLHLCHTCLGQKFDIQMLDRRTHCIRFPFVLRCCLCGLVVRGPGFDSRRYQIFWEVVGLVRGPLSLLSTTQELLGRKSSGSGLENREYGRGDPLLWRRDTLYPQKLALTSPTYGGRSVDIVRLRTKTTELVGQWTWFYSLACDRNRSSGLTFPTMFWDCYRLGNWNMCRTNCPEPQTLDLLHRRPWASTLLTLT
jgi:hypothetical protein